MGSSSLYSTLIMALTKVLLGLCLVACTVVALPDRRPPAGYGYQPPTPAPTYAPPTPSYEPPRPSYSAPQPTYQEPESEEGMPFDFAYGVKDDYKGVDFDHNSNSDGKVVTGQYRVALPDGRTQIVTYTADHYNGYQAEVTYEGEAQYPEVEPHQPAPTYQPAPAPTYQRPEPSYAPPAPTYG